MRHVSAVVLTGYVLLLPTFVNGQEALQFADFGDCQLESGVVLRDCRVGYRTFGTLNSDRSNAVLVPTSFSGTTKDLIQRIGPGRLVDSSRYFVIAVDALGNGVSSSPSNSRQQAGRTFPEFSIRDMVDVQYKLLMEKLSIRHVHAVVGVSMGGYQALQWMVSYPDFMDEVVSVVGTPRQTSYDLLQWQTQLAVLESIADSPAKEAQATKVTAAVAAISLWTPEYLLKNVRAEDLSTWLRTQEESAAQMSLWDRIAQIRALLSHDISKPFGGSMPSAARRVRARALIVISRRDHTANPQPSLALAKTIDAQVVELTTDCGHLVLQCEEQRVSRAVDRFLAR
jgi:homoserine O-acetyltransferase